MSTVLKKGAPSRSYPSRQRKLGPAPFASFEDLSDELESPADQQGAESSKMEVLPELKEDAMHSPLPPEDFGSRSHQPVTATSSSSTVTFAHSQSAPTSGPTSGLQTPSTPRIDISCASSSTPPSEDSASEKELFQGGLGFAFHEEGTEELRSSTEELDLGEMEIDSEEEKRRKRKENEMEDIYRRSSHPANIFTRRKSSTVATDDEEAQRKPSAHSLFLDGLLSRPCRHASFGATDYCGRPGAFSSLSAHSSGSARGRSPSPHKMMLETSFCGSKPIPTKSMDMESPPKEETKAISTGNISTLEPNKTPPRSPKSPRDFDRRPSSGRRSVSPFKMVYETSFCGNKPIPTQSMDQESPPKDPDEIILGNPPIARTTLTTVQVHQHAPLQSSSPASPDFDKRSRRTSSPESPKSSDHWRPVSPRVASASPSPTPGTSSSISSVIFVNKKTPTASGGGPSGVVSPDQNKNPPTTTKKKDTNIFKWPEPANATPPPARKTGKEDKKGKAQCSSSSSHPTHELLDGDDEITTEMKISEDPVVTVEDAVPIESKGLFLMNDSFEEDGDLPYVPTTLPQEKSSVVPIFPSKERRSMSVTTTPVQRPRVNRPANPASLHDYIAYSTVPKGKDDESKMKINLPREDSLTDYTQNRVKSPKKKSATSWTDFAEMGLRSPREIRRKLQQEENGAIDDVGSYHSDSSEAVGIPANGSDDEGDAMLKLPKAPFGMDLDVHSNRSSNISQEQSPALSPSVSSPALDRFQDSTRNNQQD